MGGAVSRATRFLRMYNIDNRVDRVLSKEKPTAAPRYPADLQSTNAEKNIAPETIHQKDQQLLKYLRDVKVYSTGDNPVIHRLDDTSSHPTIPPLLNHLEEPLDEQSADGAFGYVEPQRIPPGRVSLRQFLTYLQKYRDSPEEYSIDRFVDMYTIKPDIAQKLFKYHSLLALQEFSRRQSTAPARPPHIAAIELMGIEAEATRKPGPETGITSKF
ncbi:unnamed protein product [Rotaria sp. Silwood2]|nr:unnamed protein product [Rotaria sp. Silwood2]CAF2853604.1 unnamed protein product [Rotaria sp. Silwood2]CAF3139382.1 unnamed protein product [Rotaria sp. Silwood2]CAF3268517.1 unnamed protein product [Rotaria sp. Silwood2]CAF4035891.1 unnamed protein product [Rotaria sp. Silwood2]